MEMREELWMRGRGFWEEGGAMYESEALWRRRSYGGEREAIEEREEGLWRRWRRDR